MRFLARRHYARRWHGITKFFVIGEDVAQHGGAFGVTRGLFDEYGRERVVNTPISEATIVGTAVGAALAGCRPVPR